MAKYVDVEKVFCAVCEDRDRCGSPEVFCDVHSMPAEDVVPVVRGEWICHEIEDTLRWKECPVCRFEIPNVNYNYCPNCGADMRERKCDE